MEAFFILDEDVNLNIVFKSKKGEDDPKNVSFRHTSQKGWAGWDILNNEPSSAEKPGFSCPTFIY